MEVKILDESNRETPCRVLIRGADGNCVVPGEAETLQIGPDRWFVSDGSLRVQVTPGLAQVRIEKGLEYRRIKQQIDVKGETKRQFLLERWVNMKDLGYLCGENHLHVDSVRLASLLAAEGLDFGTSMTWWNGPGNEWCLPVPEGKGRSRELMYAGHSAPTSIYDAEIEHGWGAAYFLYLPGPMPIPSDPSRPNLDFVRHVVENGGFVHYQGGWSREVAVDALLGLVHAVNVCNNNFHLHRFQPRSQYSNLLGVAGFPTFPDSDVGMMKMNTDTYYRLLNWGLHLAAGAGSATGFKEVPPGYNRAYVRLGSGAFLEEFYRAWAGGENFVTNGPMLLLDGEEGHQPGEVIELPAQGGEVLVKGAALFEFPLETVEIILNGEVVATVHGKSRTRVPFEHRLSIDRGAWIAVRCTARDRLLNDGELQAYANGDRQQPSNLRFAHTSPIYVTVGGKGTAVQRSIEEGFHMLSRFEDYTRENAGEGFLAPILAAIEESRIALRQRMTDVVR